MIFRNIKYFIIQGFKGITSNSLMSLASVGVVIASLVLFGVFVLLGMDLSYIGSQIEEQCEINAYLPNDMGRDEVRKVGSLLSEIDHVKEVQLYTKEERLNNYKEGVYEEQAEVISTLEQDNPLRDAYIITLTDVRYAKQVTAAAEKIEGVEEVRNSQHIIQKILSITNTVHHISIWLLVVLIAISVFIISNTIKLGMFARRKEINIMKFVGATNWFIRWPFVIEGVVLGTIGAAVALVIIILGYKSVLPVLSGFMGNIKLLDVYEVVPVVAGSFAAMGIGMGIIGSVMSIRKHLHV